MSRKYFGLCLAVVLFIFSADFCFGQYKPLLPEKRMAEIKKDSFALARELRLFNELTEPETLEELVNPKLSTIENRKARIKECKIIERHLSRLINFLKITQEYAPNPDVAIIMLSAIQLKKMAMTYVFFAEEWQGEPLYYVNSDDEKECRVILKIPRLDKAGDKKYVLDSVGRIYESMVKKWKELDLEAPQGSIYVKLFSSDKEMQAFLNQSDEKKRIGGITFPCRFIALPWGMGKEEFDGAFEHELVHAFVGATAGFYVNSNLPRWWHEGLATFLSDDLGVRLVEYKVKMDEKGNLLSSSVESVTDEEYMEFKARFAFISKAYGKDKLASFIQRAMSGKYTNALEDILKIHDENAFFAQAAGWERERAFQNNLLFVAIIVALAYSLCIAIYVAVFGAYIYMPIWFGLCLCFLIANYHQYSVKYTEYLLITLGAIVVFNIFAHFAKNRRKRKEEISKEEIEEIIRRL